MKEPIPAARPESGDHLLFPIQSNPTVEPSLNIELPLPDDQPESRDWAYSPLYSFVKHE